MWMDSAWLPVGGGPATESRRFVWVFFARGHFAANPPLGALVSLDFLGSLSGHAPAVYSASFPCRHDMNEAVTAPRPTAGRSIEFWRCDLCLAPLEGAHAVLLLDRAGWHTTSKLVVPENITPIFLPSERRS